MPSQDREIITIVHPNGWKVAFKADEQNPHSHSRPLVCFALITEGKGDAKKWRVVGMCSHNVDDSEIDVCEDHPKFIGYLSPTEALNRFAKFE